MRAFGGSKWSQAGDNDEVNDMGVDSPVQSMVGVKDFLQALEDGEVDWADTNWWVVILFELFQKSRVQGMELFCLWVAVGSG